MENSGAPYTIDGDQLHFACPRCGHPGFVPLSMAGESVGCPGCGTAVVAPRPPSRRHRMLVAGVAVVVLVVLVVALVVKSRRSQGPGPQEASPEVSDNSATVSALAKQLVALPDWESLVPAVREPDRVRPWMERYYALEPWIPVEVASLEAIKGETLDGRRFVEAKVAIVPGVIPDRSATLVFEDTAEGLKLDWELLVDLPAWKWGRLLAEQLPEPAPYRVALKRSSLPDSAFEAFGLDPENALGFRLWVRDPAVSAFAAVSADDPLAEKLLADSGWEIGRNVIVDLSWAGEQAGDPYVTISGFVTDGWIFDGGEDARPPVSPPGPAR